MARQAKQAKVELETETETETETKRRLNWRPFSSLLVPGFIEPATFGAPLMQC